jgi:hypothetical protein
MSEYKKPRGYHLLVLMKIPNKFAFTEKDQ